MNRKELKQQYKESRPPMGVYRVHNKVGDRTLLGTSNNLPAMLNRQLAQLKMGAHANRELQQDWNQLGPEAFEFEVLDTLAPPEEPDYNPAADLSVLEALWLDRLAPYDERGYNRRPTAKL